MSQAPLLAAPGHSNQQPTPAPTHEEGTVVHPPAATPAVDEVDDRIWTSWKVDYSKVGGSSKKLPTSTKKTDARTLMTTFKSLLTSKTEHLVEQLTSTHAAFGTSAGETKEAKSDWSFGWKPDRGGGTSGNDGAGLWDKVTGAVEHAGGVLIKSVPIAKGLLSLVGGVGSFVSTLAVTYGRSSSNTDTGSSSNESSIDSQTKVMTGEELARSFSTEMLTQTQSALETAIETQYGVEVSHVEKSGAASKETVGTSTSGTTITHEVGQPSVTIERLD